MFPLFNSHPYHSNATPPSAPQQVMGNPSNFAPNPMQIQPQMGMLNPQTLAPYNNSADHFVPSQFFPSQQAPQSLNNHQAMGQFLSQSSLNPSQFLNQNLNLGMGLSYPNQMQNMNQFFRMPVPNFNAGSFNLPLNLAFVANGQVGFGNGSGIMQHSMNTNGSNQTPNVAQQHQGVQAFGHIPPQQNMKFGSSPGKSQGNYRNPTGNHKINNNGKNPRNKHFVRNLKHEASQSRFMKYQFHSMANTKGNFRSRQMQLKKGNDNDEARKTSVANSGKQAQAEKKRSISLNYTEQEVRQWREERRKNYPSKANVEKKLTEKLKDPEVSEKITKLRRQQLKEILAKQAELGCEVAEIPSSYLSDSEQQLSERKVNGRPFTKKEKFHKKFNKRGRFNQNECISNKSTANHDSSHAYSPNDCFTKKRRLAKHESITYNAASKREPSLLQKLLSADIRRDKRHLLQVFRFMVMNSFFGEWPEKPLKFPLVTVKETGDEDELIEGTSKGGGDGNFEETEESIDNNGVYVDNMEKPDAGVQAVRKDKRNLEGGDREEEGEIID